MSASPPRVGLLGYAGRLFGRATGGARQVVRVLLLHGFTGDGHDWSLWPADAPAALAIDLPGHGDSPDPTGDFADEIERLLRALPPSIDRVIGYSLGGRIALSLIAAAPARFRAATILSAHPGLRDNTLRDPRRQADRRWIEQLRSEGIGAFVDAWERQPLFATQATLAPELLATQRERRLGQRAEGLARNLACFGLAEMPETWTALARWPSRLRWLVGARDEKFAAIAQQVRQQRPDTLLTKVPNAGHNLLLEAPNTVQQLCARIGP